MEAQSPQTDSPSGRAITVYRANVVASSEEPFGSLVTLRQLANGQLLVNDVRGRRALLLDSSLSVIRIVADSGQSERLQYGRRPAMMVPYFGDSTLFIDGSSLSILVLDEGAKHVRTIAVRRTRDLSFITDARYGKLQLDKGGNMIYRAGPGFYSPPKELFPGMVGVMLPKDSAPLVRLHSNSQTDTITLIHTPAPRLIASADSLGAPTFISVLDPLDNFDDWAVLSDGTVGVFRGRDFTLQLFDTAGVQLPTVKVPFKWRRLTDFEKGALIDTAKARRRVADDAARAAGRPFQRVQFIDPSELADYYPAFGPNSVLADKQNHFWVKILATTQSPTIAYHIIDRAGNMLGQVLVDKVSEIVSVNEDGSVFLLTSVPQAASTPAAFRQYKLQRAYVQ